MSDNPATASANEDQVAYWNGVAGERWAARQARLDAVFAPLSAAALAFAAPAEGSRILDIGCGTGATVLALAEAVGATGHVLGVDVSRPMLAVAERRLAAAGLTQARLLLADASSTSLPQAGFDLAFSRFGVMFFADPAAAFARIRTALAATGRLAFMCWQPMAHIPWMSVPAGALQARLPPTPPADPFAPGPFAFADPARVRAILTQAGFGDIAVEPNEAALQLAGPGDLAGAVEFVAQVGPASRLYSEAAPEVRPALRAALHSALAPFDGPEGVTLGGAVWLISARV